MRASYTYFAFVLLLFIPVVSGVVPVEYLNKSKIETKHIVTLPKKGTHHSLEFDSNYSSWSLVNDSGESTPLSISKGQELVIKAGDKEQTLHIQTLPEGSNLFIDGDALGKKPLSVIVSKELLLNNESIDIEAGFIALNAPISTKGNIDIKALGTANEKGILSIDYPIEGAKVHLFAQDMLRVNDHIVANKSSGKSQIQLLSENIVEVHKGTLIDASHPKGGGTILIGGDYQGKEGTTTAQNTFISSEAIIQADATGDSDAGRIIIWAEKMASVHGKISAKAQNGKGGFIETSGKENLSITATPDVSSQTGKGGEWLIDPYDIEIVAGSGTTNINNTSPFNPIGNTAQLGVDLITSALGLGNVTINTNTGGTQNGDITLSTDLNFTGIAGVRTLTLNAEGDIILNNNISYSIPNPIDRLNVSLNARGNIAASSGDIITNGGNISIDAGGTTTLNTISSAGVIGNAGGDIAVTSENDINFNNGTVASSGGSSLGGNIFIESTSGDINTTSTSFTFNSSSGGGTGGSITLTSGGDILKPLSFDVSSGAASAGDITVTTDGSSLLSISNFAVSGALPSDIDIEAGGELSISSDINVSSMNDGGTISLDAQGNINITSSTINTTSSSSDGGDFVTESANGNITIGADIQSGGNSGSGNITLTADNGSITASSLSSVGGLASGGNITITSLNDITADNIIANGRSGGSISLETPANIVINSANVSGTDGQGDISLKGDDITISSGVLNASTASGVTAPSGGTVSVDASGNFITTAPNFSISANGTSTGGGGGSIDISVDGAIDDGGGGNVLLNLSANGDTEGGEINLDIGSGTTRINNLDLSGLNEGGDLSISGGTSLEFLTIIDLRASIAGGNLYVNVGGTVNSSSFDIYTTGNDESGDISIAADGNISLSGVDASGGGNANSNAGDILIYSTSGNIDAGYIITDDASGNGGDITLAAAGDIRITNNSTVFGTPNVAAVASRGSISSGRISIVHSGVAFDVVGAATNGTADTNGFIIAGNSNTPGTGDIIDQDIPNGNRTSTSGLLIIRGGGGNIISTNNGNWSDPATWNCDCVPTIFDDVTVQHDVLLDTDAQTNNLNIDDSGTGTELLDNSINGYEMTINGDLRINSGGEIRQANGGRINLYGNVEITDGGRFNVEDSEIYFEGNNQEYRDRNDPVSIQEIGDAIINSATALNLAFDDPAAGWNPTTVTINTTLNANNWIIGLLENSGNIAWENNGTFNPGGANQMVAFIGNAEAAGDSDFQNLLVSASGDLTLLGDTHIAGDLIIADGCTISFGNSGDNINVYLAGDLIDAAAAPDPSQIDAQMSTFHFNGNSTQTITATPDANPIFYNLIIDQSPASTIDATASGIAVNNELDLQSGVINGTVVMGNIFGLSVIGGNINSYVNGPFIVSNNEEDVMLPVGKNGKYAPVTINNLSNIATVRVEYFNSPPNANSVGTGIDRVSPSEYWRVYSTVPINLDLTLSYSDDNPLNSNVSDAPNLRIARNNGVNNWLDLDNTISGSGSPSGTITVTNTPIPTTLGANAEFTLANATGGTNFTPPAEIFVDIDATSGANNGTSWADAYTDLQDALDAAGTGTKIFVAEGTYKPSTQYDFINGTVITSDPRAASFKIPDDVEVYGGFAGTETSFAPSDLLLRDFVTNETILSGDLDNSNSISTGDAYHVVYTRDVSSATTVDGFTIRGGNATGIFPRNSGGGWYNHGQGLSLNSSPTVKNCLITQNSSAGGGAGMYNNGRSQGNANPEIINCTFLENTAAGNGGGMYNNGSVSGNSSPTVTNCTFSQNRANNGGGVYNDGINGTSSPSFTNCLFSQNTATVTTFSSGGGMFSTGNSSGTSPSITNCTFTENVANGNGGGMHNFGNTGTISPIIRNSIFWNNTGTGQSWSNNNANTNVSYTLVEEASGGLSAGTTAGVGMIYAQNPFFTDAASQDYSLKPCSPAINAGDDSFVPSGVTTDLSGNNRLIGTVDMGAYEYNGASVQTEFFVRASGGSDSNSGADFANAFQTLEKALQSACTGSKIYVAVGTYTPIRRYDFLNGDDLGLGSGTDRDQSFKIPDGVEVYGGFAGTEISFTPSDLLLRDFITNETILSGEIGSPGSGDNTYHVVYTKNASSATRVDGFTIRGGNASAAPPNDLGGGWYNDGSGNNSSPTINKCAFFQNDAVLYGGGMYNNGSSAGVASPRITNTSFVSNASGNSGGGMYNNGDGGNSSPDIINCVFYQNGPTDLGGGMYNNGSNVGDSSPNITNSTFFSNNTSEGGGMYNDGTAGGNSSPIIRNSIFWSNIGSGQSWFNSDATPNVGYSLVEEFDEFTITNGDYTGTTVTAPSEMIYFTDPQFNGPSDFTLQAGSPAINEGIDAAITATGVTTDLAGNPRLVGTVDMGAYESQVSITLGTLSSTSYCAGNTISVPFTTLGTFGAGNDFTAELSDASGNFSTPTATQTGTSPISLAIPASAITGTGYQVRVVSSNPILESDEINVSIGNQTPPTFTPMPDFAREADEDACYFTNTTTATQDRISEGTATSSCGGITYDYELTGATVGSLTSLANVEFNIGVTTVSWSASTNSGTTPTDEFTVTVEDNKAPILIAPNDTTIYTALYSCETDSTINLDLGVVDSSDNCLFRVFNDAPIRLPIGTTTVLWSAQDSSGNITTDEQIVNVLDLRDVQPSDSLALVAIYNQTGGNNWTRSWDLNTPVYTWQGVSTQCGQVTRLDLADNNLRGTLPTDVLNLSRRTESDFSLDISRNILGFESAEDYVSAINNFNYAPQAKIYRPRTITLGEGQPFSISSETPGDSNEYQWYKDGVAIDGANNPELTINNVLVSDAGVYHCMVSNTRATRLTLERHKVTLIVEGFVEPLDSIALVQIFEATAGNGWNQSWNLNEPVSTWEGVLLNGTKVRELDLSSQNLSGNLPDVFDADIFSELTYLSLFDNQLGGEIPSSIGEISTLTYLDLDQNDFEGQVPTSFGNLVNLQVLWLSRNNLTSLPDEIGNLRSLKRLYLNGNLFEALPDAIGELSELLVLNISDNELDDFPISITNLSKLRELYANRNEIDLLPEQIQNLGSLLILEFNTNDLIDLPDGLLNLSNLKELHIAENRLTFEDLLPLSNQNYEVFDYAPQAPIDEEGEFLVAIGTDLSLEVSGSATGNTYRWRRDGELVSSLQTLLLSSITGNDAGRYVAFVANPELPELELERKPIFVQTICAESNELTISIPEQTTFCSGQPFGLRLSIEQELIGQEVRVNWRKDDILLAFSNRKSITVTQEGVYRAEVITGEGCTARSNEVAITINPQPEVSIELNADTVLISTVIAEEEITYQWLRDGEAIEEATQSTFEPEVSGEYSLLVLTPTGCTTTSRTVSVTIDVTTGTSEPIGLRNLELFPNPNNGQFMIDFGSSSPNGNPKFILLNAIGQQINIQAKRITTNRYQINTKKLSGGLYFLKINTKDGSIFRKFIIEE